MAQIKGLNWQHQIEDGELKVIHGNDIVTFQWPLKFDWSLKMLDWHIRDRMGLRHPDLLPPALCDSYGGLEVQ